MDLKAFLTPRRKSVSAKQIHKYLDKDTKRLDLTEKKLGDEAFRATINSIYHLEVEQLDLFGNGLTDAAISDICELLTINRHIKIVNMEYNKFSSEGIFILSQFLKDNNTLIRLDLYGNRVESEGCKHLAKAIQTNRTLSFLGLFGSKISDEGALYFLPALQHNKILKDLILDNNSISEVVLEAISHFLNRNKGLATKPLPNISTYIEKMIKKEDLFLFSDFLTHLPMAISQNSVNNLLQINNPIRKSSSQQTIATQETKPSDASNNDDFHFLQSSDVMVDKSSLSSGGFEDSSNKNIKISYQSSPCTTHQQWLSERDKLLQTLHQLSIERETTLHQVSDLHQKLRQATPFSLFQ